MSQRNHKYKRLEALLSQSNPAQPDPVQPQPTTEVDALKEHVAELEAKLASQPQPQEARVSSYMQPITRREERENSSESESGRKQIALWIAKIFVGVSLAFLSFSIFTLLVSQSGQADLTDMALMPAVIFMFAANLIAHRLINRDQFVRGGWLLYLVNTLPLPVLAVFSTQNLYLLAASYLIIFSLLLISLVLPRRYMWRAIAASGGGFAVITAIELWNATFRVGGHHLDTFTPVVVALAVLAALAFIIRQAAAGNIRTKLITAFLLMSVLSVGIVGVMAQRTLSSSLTENIGSNLSELANAKAIEIGQSVDRELDLLKALALNSHVRAAAGSANITNQLDETEIARRDAQWASAASANNDTDPMVSKVLHNSTSAELRDFQQEFPQHAELFLTNQAGINIASTSFTSDYYQADEEWWQIAYRDGLYIGQPVYDESTNVIALPMAAAIVDEETGKVLGILRATVDFELLAESLIAGRFGQTGHTDIYLPTGQELTLEPLEAGSFELVLKDASLDINALFQSTEPYMELEHEGILGLASQARMAVAGDTDDDTKVINDLNWRVVSIQEQSEALQPVRTQTRNIIVLVIVINLVVIATAIYLARVITNPIVQLKTVAEKVASGDLTAQAKVETRDEIGTMAAAFNDMTSQLRNLFGSLEQRVQDRTHDLELASEVGRTITEKVANLNEMLTAAAEMIRSRFGLYYTQVYLLDPSGRKLILRAGTGEVGEQLLKRNHHLLVESSSLNGRTVIERQPIIVADTLQAVNFKPNALLPGTRSEMTVPLIAGDRVIGVLDMQSEQPESLNETNLPAFEALAGQLAVALQNASLFADVKEARAEVEAQIRHVTERGWQEFMNAIERGQKMGYSFDQTQVVALKGESLEAIPADVALSVPLHSAGADLGIIQIANEPDHVWASKDVEITHAVAARLVQHVENLRLLAQAEQYRAEAEQAVRRLTREGWSNYLQSETVEGSGFEYDLNEVHPLNGSGNGDNLSGGSHPLTVRDEVIGEFAIHTGDDSHDGAQEILSAVAAQLSSHIDKLRLSEQTESALTATQASEAKLSEALNIARLANWEYDVEKDLFTFNDNFYSIFHTTVEAVGSYKISSAEYAQRFVHPEDVPIVGREIGKALSSTDRHYTTNLEHRVLFVDGGTGHIAVEIHIDRDENGKIVRYYGANQDITERKNAELLIQESEAKLSEALQIAKLANWEYDVEKDLFTFNDNFYSIFHTTAEQVGGYKLSSMEYAQRFVHPDDAPIVGREIEKALSSTDRHYSTNLEHRVLFADGGTGHIAVDLHIDRDENGKITRYYGANQDITERKKAELAIQESEAKLSEALQIAKLANWEYDYENDLFTFNDHFYSIFHTTAETVGGYKLSSAQYAQFFVHPDDAALVGEEIGKTIASTERHFSAKLEHRVIYADGGIGYISVDIHLERDENGKIVRWYGANQDITERKKAEEIVRLAQERAQIILETVTLPMVITRVSDNVLTFINQPATEVARVKYEDAINHPSPDFYYNPEDRKRFITELRANGRVYDMVVQLMREGEPFWALMSARIFNYQNEPSILTTFTDITDRVSAEEAVARRAAELQTVAEVSTTTATALEPEYLLQSVVDMTKERFGLYHAHIYLADDAWQTLLLAAGAGEVGKQMVADGWNIPINHASSIVAEAARNRKSVIANDVLRDQESGFLSNKLLPDTRSEMAVPMIAGDKVLGVFDVQSDVAERFTEEDANIYTTLASQVGVALQNARLYVEQAATVAQLRELDRLKSAFLANMSHELRTPLNSILGFADVMLEELDGPLTDYMNNDLRLIQKNGQHLLHLINDVLDMAKIEAGRMNLNPERFRVHEVLQEVTSITSNLASDKNLALFIDETADQEAEIYADRTRIRQVMINLVNNSIKFTDSGSIAAKVTPMDGGRVLISVKDTGIGIPPDKLAAVFQEFIQVDSTTTRKVGGTGLGLPISRRLVEMHGGKLWAESTGINGQGSTFFVELPIEARITEVIEKQVK